MAPLHQPGQGTHETSGNTTKDASLLLAVRAEVLQGPVVQGLISDVHRAVHPGATAGLTFSEWHARPAGVC